MDFFICFNETSELIMLIIKFYNFVELKIVLNLCNILFQKLELVKYLHSLLFAIFDMCFLDMQK